MGNGRQPIILGAVFLILVCVVTLFLIYLINAGVLK